MLKPSQNLLVASPSGPLRGTLRVPGDKSISHRAVIFASISDGVSTIRGLADNDDVASTINAVEAFGAEIETRGDATQVRGCQWRSPAAPIDCGNSGTTARLLLGILAGSVGVKSELHGDESLSQRPMARVVNPLSRMGAKITLSEAGTLPALIVGRALAAITHRNVPASAQVKTALLLAALNAQGCQRVIEPFKTRDHGEALLRQFGCPIQTEAFESLYTVGFQGPCKLQATVIRVPGDPSSAAFPAVAALIVRGSQVRIDDVCLTAERRGLFEVLKKMGAQIGFSKCENASDESLASITTSTSELKAVDIPASKAPSMIDEYPIAAMAAGCARGTSIFRGLCELRHKESDRLERLATGLNACGVGAEVVGDDLIIHGAGSQPAGNGSIDCRGDHRIAMAFAVLGLASCNPVSVTNAQSISTSFPSFVSLMGGLGANLAWAL